MSGSAYDAIIIGGGPGGSTVGTLLSRAGKRALIVERERFPRFHIGESLLPYNRALFEELGVLNALEAEGFPRKLGAQFHLGNGHKSLRLKFANGCFTREPAAIQVERARFDHILLKHAAASGAEVREGCAVTKFETRENEILVVVRDEAGRSEEVRGAFVVDASGRANFTGNLQGLRIIHPKLRKLALFGHFEGVQLDDGPSRGDTQIVRLDNKWFWLIPISESKTSVGCVLDQAEYAASGKSADALFADLWQGSTAMRERLGNARALTHIQATGDFSYYNRRLIDSRLLRVGDAAGFMDPIFSAGVYLAMYSGKLAAGAVLESLVANDSGAARFKAYEREVFRAMRYYWEMVEAFYTTPFMELFLEPRPKFHLPDAVTAILAGELAGGWRLEWRKRLFFWLTKLQARIPLVPRIDFREPEPPLHQPDRVVRAGP